MYRVFDVWAWIFQYYDIITYLEVIQYLNEILLPGSHPHAQILDTNKAVPVKVTWMVNHQSLFLLFTDKCDIHT